MLASSYATGFLLGLSLLIAIGAQNAFVLRQGLLRQHVFAAVLFCAVADMALIVVGVGGLSLLIADVAARYEAALLGLAALWLAGYGVMRLRSAICANAAIKADAAESDSLAAVLTTGAVLTFGNPHVHLDSVVLLGTVSVRFTGMDKLAKAPERQRPASSFSSRLVTARACLLHRCSGPTPGACLIRLLRW